MHIAQIRSAVSLNPFFISPLALRRALEKMSGREKERSDVGAAEKIATASMHPSWAYHDVHDLACRTLHELVAASCCMLHSTRLE